MTPLFCKTHYSLREAISKPEDVLERCKELGYKSCAITDTLSISGAVSFAKMFNKAGIKPIIGVTLEIDNSLYTVLSKNMNGWYDLTRLVSKSYEKEFPNLTWEEYGNRPNLIIIDGQEKSELFKLKFRGNRENITRHIDKIRERSDYYVGIQRTSPRNHVLDAGKSLRDIAKSCGVKTLALPNPHYLSPADAIQHKMVLCTSINSTLSRIHKDIASGIPHEYEDFFNSDKFYLPSSEEITQWGYEQEDVENTDLVAETCEAYTIGGPPQLPAFPCQNGQSEVDYLRDLCREGWKRRNKDWGDNYVERIKMELDVLTQFPVLSTYFLIVQDYVKYAKDSGWLVGPGRGSAGGCLASYLLGIIEVDPIPHDLIFERFYNAGRNSPGQISLPDIDIDFPPDKREAVIHYLENKYGSDRVAHMATYGRLQGRSAIRETLRVNDALPLDQINRISKLLPQEFEIADDLEACGETSIIKYTLENLPKTLADYVNLDDKGNIEGDLARYFEQAIKLEGIYINQGKHASGIVIAPRPIAEMAPLVKDAKGNVVVGLDMEDCEAIGLPKFDILGVSILSKLQGVRNLLRYGRIYE